MTCFPIILRQSNQIMYCDYFNLSPHPRPVALTPHRLAHLGHTMMDKVLGFIIEYCVWSASKGNGAGVTITVLAT